jgi:AcrR family transcriptional regulator
LSSKETKPKQSLMKSNPLTQAANSEERPRPDRRQNILDASQRLFARFGYHAVTIRQIAEEAQVPLALVGYYFGQKQELYDAIFGHWSAAPAQRSKELREVMAKTSGDRLHNIIAVMVEPIVKLRSSPEGASYALFVTRGITQQGVEEDRAIREYFDPVAAEFIDAIHLALADEMPGYTHAHAAWGFQFALGALLHYLSDQRVERLSNGVNVAGDPSVGQHLIVFIVAGLRGAAQSFLATPAIATEVAAVLSAPNTKNESIRAVA